MPGKIAQFVIVFYPNDSTLYDHSVRELEIIDDDKQEDNDNDAFGENEIQIEIGTKVKRVFRVETLDDSGKVMIVYSKFDGYIIYTGSSEYIQINHYYYIYFRP